MCTFCLPDGHARVSEGHRGGEAAHVPGRLAPAATEGMAVGLTSGAATVIALCIGCFGSLTAFRRRAARAGGEGWRLVRNGPYGPRVAVAAGALLLALPAAASAEVRHFERVSPADKGDGDIIAEGEAIVAAQDGNGATFDSRMGFADTVGSGALGRTTY